MNNLKRTSLYEKHVALGANLIDFGGFHMPLYYTSIAIEHHLVRKHAGMFDVSHMGQIVVEGKDALKFVNYVLTSSIEISHKMQYALLLNEAGGILDDLMVYPFSSEQILMVVNASNIDKDYNHILGFTKDFDVRLRNLSEDFNCIAVQGPESFSMLSQIFDNLPKHSSEYIFSHDENGPLLISRSGYTGEDGFEVYLHDSFAQIIWDKLYSAGVHPIGLGARDTLRFEAAMPLYGNEMDETVNPIEAGLTFGVDFNKAEFIGKTALLKYKDNPLRKNVGFELQEKNIARHGYEVYANDQIIGHVTTGYLSPTTNQALGFALIDINYSKLGTIIYINIRNKFVPAVVRNKKFINKNNKV
jgi:aminomethyltransferase